MAILDTARGDAIRRVDIDLLASSLLSAGGCCDGSVSAGRYQLLECLIEQPAGFVTLQSSCCFNKVIKSAHFRRMMRTIVGCLEVLFIFWHGSTPAARVWFGTRASRIHPLSCTDAFGHERSRLWGNLQYTVEHVGLHGVFGGT